MFYLSYINIFLFSLIGGILSYCYIKYYPVYFENKLLKSSEEYLKEFNIKTIGDFNYNLFHLIKNKSISIVLMEMLFYSLFLCFFLYQINLIDFSNLIIKTNYLSNDILSIQYIKIMWFLLTIIFLCIGMVDFKTKWLTNEENVIIILFGLLNVYLTNHTDYLLNFIIAFFVFSIYQLFHTFFNKINLGSGDLLLISSLFLFFKPLDIANIIFLAGIISLIITFYYLIYLSIFLTLKRKNRNFTFKRNFKSSRLYFKLSPQGFGQSLLLASLLLFIFKNRYDIYNIYFLTNEKIDLIKNLIF